MARHGIGSPDRARQGGHVYCSRRNTRRAPDSVSGRRRLESPRVRTRQPGRRHRLRCWRLGAHVRRVGHHLRQLWLRRVGIGHLPERPSATRAHRARPRCQDVGTGAGRPGHADDRRPCRHRHPALPERAIGGVAERPGAVRQLRLEYGAPGNPRCGHPSDRRTTLARHCRNRCALGWVEPLL